VTDEKPNETAAIPELLARHSPKACVAMIDAMDAQTEIAYAPRA
jgi:predicted transposase YbfD/YdcC